MTREEFVTKLAALEREYAHTAENPGSYGCRDCEKSANCMFCEGCRSCYRCNYCVDCSGCSECTKCEHCEDCNRCAYCVESKGCTGSQYLIKCVSCSDCTYCFGCVGLVRAEFHILNEAYDRKTFFEITKRLAKELRIPSAA